jgi:ATP-dependent helicase/nuclease subunit B
MVLRSLLQDNAPFLRVFRRAARQPRFCEKLAIQIREFKSYSISPETLLKVSGVESFPPPLREKLSDLSRIYQSYSEFIKDRFTDPEDVLTELAVAVTNGVLPTGTRIWVDGFAGFTQQEFSVLAALLVSADQVNIALCLDPANARQKLSEHELFHPTLDTYRRLRQVCGDIGLRARPPLTLPYREGIGRFSGNKALAYLESHFNAYPIREFTGEAKGIRLVAAAGCRAEVESAARDILHNVREKGWRFREMSVILRDFDRYHDLVTAVFEDFGIPYFLDNRRTAAHHPLVELLRSALEAILTNIGYVPVFHMLKTGLFPIEQYDVDRLENYVRAHGIRGKAWLTKEPWHWRYQLALNEEEGNGHHSYHETLDGINQAREIFCTAFSPLYDALSGGGNKKTDVYCRALWEFMMRLESLDKLQDLAERELRRGKADAIAVHSQVWRGVIGLLDQLSDILGERQLTLQEFFETFLSGLESLSLGLVPAGTDQVSVGSVERSRQPKLKAAYVLGLSEGDFPARLAEDGLFADGERHSLAGDGVEMAVTRRQRLFHEQYLSYIAVTRSSDYLWASFPLADGEGRAKRPSSLFNRLQAMFPAAEVCFYGNTAEGDDLHYLAGVDNCAALLLLKAGQAVRHGEMSPLWSAAYREAIKNPAVKRRMRKLWPSLRYTNYVPDLSVQTVGSLYGAPLKSSVSRLELFARCPFAHFARYGLQLDVRREFKVEAPDMGVFFHAALRIFTEQLLDDGLDWGTLTAADAENRMSAVVELLIPRLQNEILLSSARLRYLASRLKETMTQAAVLLTEHARRGSFRPVAVEIPFGRGGGLPPWQVPLDDQSFITLTGQIDRLDVATGETASYIRIIDYKSNPAELSLADAWHGLSLQLLCYMAVMNESACSLVSGDFRSAGALYFAVNGQFSRVDNPPSEGREKENSLRMDGIILGEREAYELMGGSGDLVRAELNNDGTFSRHSRVATAEQIASLMTFAREKVASLGTEILSGKAAVLPYRKKDGSRACQFCEFQPVCRFDTGTAGNGYRHLSSFSHQDVLDTLSRRSDDKGVLPDGT